MLKLAEEYQERAQKKRGHAPPTQSHAQLRKWSMLFGWPKRAELYDAEIEAEKNARIALERKEVMESGIALDYVRVRKLQRLSDFLEEQIYAVELVKREKAKESSQSPDVVEDTRLSRLILLPASQAPGEAAPEVDAPQEGVRFPNVWVRDVKGIGKDEHYERVEVDRFNAPIIAEFRAAMADAAAETGGRKLKVDTTSVQVGITAEDLGLAQTQLQEWAKGRIPDLPQVLADSQDEDGGDDAAGND